MFLTVLPVGGSMAAQLGRAYFPLVGAGLGLVAGGIDFAVSGVASPLIGAVAAVMALAVLTGGLHLDGLADSADGLLPLAARERRLEIMRDPRVGSFGVVALVLVLAGDAALLGAMPAGRVLTALVAAGAISRLAMLCVIAFVPPARNDGLGAAATGGPRWRDVAFGAVVTVLACLLDPRRAVFAALAAAVSTLLLVALARRRIGGATGDVYGACCELGQMAALVAFAMH